MSTWMRSAVGVALVALTAGCATGYESAHDRGYSDGPSTIEVSNHNWSDMNIYLVVNGIRSRLGTVMSMTEETFRVPSFVSGTGSRVQLLADPIGSSQTYLSQPIDIGLGQQVQWRLENAIQLSSIMMR